MPGATEADIDQAIDNKVILRTWALRGTLHYVAPADIHWMLALIAPRIIAGNASRYKQLELDEPTLRRSADLIANAVHIRGQQTRGELFGMLRKAGISTAGQRGVYMLQRTALERLVFQGHMRGGATTFLALPAGKTRPKDEALAELARRYFTSHGPATLADYTQWSGLTVTDARAGLEACNTQLLAEQVDGAAYFFSSQAALKPEHTVYLLPGFDEFVLAYRDRSALVAAEFADAVHPGGSGNFAATIISAGRVVGTWRRTIKKKVVEISTVAFTRLTRAQRDGLQAAAQRYAVFLGLPLVLVTG